MIWTYKQLSGYGFELLSKNKEEKEDREIEITSISDDTRKAKSKGAFFAYDGIKSKGLDYIEKAIEKGISAIFCDAMHTEFLEKNYIERDGIIFFVSTNFTVSAGRLISAFYKNPSHEMNVVGITGTNGKTTVAILLYRIFKELQIISAYAGTLGRKIDKEYSQTGMTTLGTVDNFDFLSLAKKKNTKLVFMEASSHGLQQGRLEGVLWNIGIFTNLSPEHLDYHETMNSYYEAKKILFDRLLEQDKKYPGTVKGCIVCVHTVWGKKLYKEISSKKPSFPLISVDEAESDCRIVSVVARGSGYRCTVVYNEQRYEIKTKLIGMFNLYNSICIFLTALINNVPAKEILAKLAEIDAPIGRMERIYSEKNRQIFIDYAHTPDALEQALRAIQLTNPVRILLVFGCGGERDREKRPEMGKIATLHADFTIVTNDNPRREDEKNIIQDIKSGILNANYVVIPDRDKAIFAAMQILKAHEVLLIAGKGHENYQIIGLEKKPFSDSQVVFERLEQMEWEE